MTIEFKTCIFASIIFLTSCATNTDSIDSLSNVYVADFHSDDINSCRPSDVDLSHKQALEFFQRSKQVEYKIIHDHYDLAPCYIEGTLRKNDESCDWQIRAGATGEIKCGDKVEVYVCEDCDALFE